jgi:hypothetical protein
MATWVWIVIVIAVVVVVALVAVVARRQRTAVLRDRFGPEYDRAIESHEDQRSAEADLLARQKERGQLNITPLPEATRVGFAGEWRDLQERFLDQPAESADEADTLITRVMEARGYPMKDFDAQAELISVDHPSTVENYRFAHAVQQRAHTEQASTEDLREALLRYRSLFDELLRPEGNGAVGVTADEAQPAGYDNGRHVTADDPETQVPAARATESQVRAARAAGQQDDLAAADGGSADPAVMDTEYDNQRIGRRDGR